MKYFVCLFVLLTIASCFHSSDKKVDIAPVKIIRFDKDLQSFDLKNFESSESKMVSKYGDIYSFYIETLMGLGVMKPTTDPYYYGKYLPIFLEGEYAAMMDSCQKYVIGDIDQIESELTTCYSRLKAHFPEKNPSTIYSFFISPNSQNAKAAFSYGNDTIGINWFHYLGKSFPLYQPLYEGYSYMIEWNQKDYIAKNVMLVEYNLLYDRYRPKEQNSELIYHMIEEGKKYYFLDIVCKDKKDAVKIGYTDEQYKWCQDNEFDIWAHYKENKLLYSIETMDIKRNVEEGPNTPGMPAQSPGMVGAWVGWQIVKKYMTTHSVSLKQLIQTSPKDIFNQSAYKPSK